jgi:hypothetical protein
MAGGMEGLMQTLLRSMGFNPQEFVQGLEKFCNMLVDRLNSFEKRADELAATQQEILSTLAEIRIILDREQDTRFDLRELAKAPCNVTDSEFASSGGRGAGGSSYFTIIDGRTTDRDHE